MPRVSAAERLKQNVQAGQAAFAAGKLDEAVNAWSAALRGAQRLAAPETLQTTLRNNLAGLYHSLGKLPQARRAYEQALADAGRKHGADSQPAATILNNLAELERSTGNAARAEPLFRRAIAILEKHPAARTQFAGVLANTAECLRDLHRLDEASTLNARALSILEAAGAAATGAAGVLLNNMARIEEQRGRFRDAEALFDRCVAVLAAAGPPFEAQRRAAIANYAAALRRHAASLEKT